MKAIEILWRWLPTFLAFPLAGLLSALALGPIRDPLSAAVSGAIVGSFLGLAQWWALKPLNVSFDWAWTTAVALMVSSPIASALTSFATDVISLTLWGAIAGAIVGLGQGWGQRLASTKTLLWTALVSGTWSLAWFISGNVIVDAEANYAVFGSTGAIVATAILSLFLNSILSKKK